MERLIPISRKQHDSFNNLSAGIQKAQVELQTMANTLLNGVEENFGKVGVLDAVCRDGVYSLRINVPDIAPAHQDIAPAEVMTG